jgi:hypothetical protein
MATPPRFTKLRNSLVGSDLLVGVIEDVISAA